jgi:glycosyltransferase involved in cell wall biosynthesis
LRFPNVNTYWLRNGIDFECLYTDSIFQNFREQKGLSADDYILVYTGLIGYAQGLEVIIKSAEILKDHLNIRFFIAGEGPERIKLIKMAKEKSLDNVEFLPNLPHKQALNIISSCDAAIVPLKNNPLFRGAIPSKLFEPLAFGKPIILGVDGEARDIFINKGGCGLYFEPENAFELATCIMKLVNDRSLGKRLGENGKRYVVNEFDRKKIATDFNEVLLRLFNN